MDLSPEELHALLQAKVPKSFRLIDVREDDEYAICHIDGAELLPISRFVEDSPQRLTNKDAHLVIYCHHGMRSNNAAMWLRSHGYSNVSNLNGGIDAWAERIDPEMNRY
jgi:adenylyltransferase/sulfurtransferase